MPRIGPLVVNPAELGIVGLHNVHMISDETAKNTSVRVFIIISEDNVLTDFLLNFPESRNFTS